MVVKMTVASHITSDAHLVEFVSQKPNSYDVLTNYFKFKDKKQGQKLLKSLSKAGDNLLLPMWKSDNGDYFIKIKEKILSHNQPLNNGQNYLMDISLKYFSIDSNLRGYYASGHVINEKDNSDEDNST